jgi:hypothetical protein
MKDAHMEKVLGVRFGPEISFGFESKILDLTASSDKISKTQKIEKSSQNIYLMLDYFLTYWYNTVTIRFALVLAEFVGSPLQLDH